MIFHILLAATFPTTAMFYPFAWNWLFITLYSTLCLDPAFDLEAEIDVADVGNVTSDDTGFDINHVYEPGSSTSATSGTFFLTARYLMLVIENYNTKNVLGNCWNPR